MKEMIKAVLFDFDMTLVDSSHAIYKCTSLMAKKMGLHDVTYEEVLATIGLPIDDSWKQLWGDCRPEWLDYYRQNFREVELTELKPYPDAIETIELFRSKGIKVGVVSNRRFARRSVDAARLTPYMDVVIGLEDVENAKPHPEPLFKGFQAIGVEPSCGIYVGDTDIDMKTACAAGVHGVGVATGNFSVTELRQAGAWKSVSCLKEIPNVVL